MKLSLIAMSGSGKSRWSAKLATYGFRHFDCDPMIAAKLGPALARPDGTLLSLGEWMGFPYQAGYRQREARYLAYEKEVESGRLSECRYSSPATIGIRIACVEAGMFSGTERKPSSYQSFDTEPGFWHG